ncbi:hypothetical protein [Pseudomonas phage LKA1]|uniref:Uncharacterized protein n=1 Tax=Pseudomonas phage LKA1 TaxID=386793 RepID=Q0E613_9CAUD|nr:hypothetical protein AV952_gp01 [Pseudomonas phage LKA1]CAK24969.1 hypothetical protein [Pseudomonas phage LKA1]
MRNERQANIALAKQVESKYDKAQRIMQTPQPFAFRLAALNASDSNPGKVW